TKFQNLVLYSDYELPPEANHVLKLAHAQIAQSPLFKPARIYRVYLCNTLGRRYLYMHGAAGGTNLYPIRASFLSPADIPADRLLKPDGKPAPENRPLHYFIAHEVTHEMTGEALGPAKYRELPAWIREGYADYVAKGPLAKLEE